MPGGPFDRVACQVLRQGPAWLLTIEGDLPGPDAAQAHEQLLGALQRLGCTVIRRRGERGHAGWVAQRTFPTFLEAVGAARGVFDGILLAASGAAGAPPGR